MEKGGRVATAAEVRVDGDGTLHVDRLVTAFDCGAVVNPDSLQNQIEGAVMMGLGGALFEAIEFADGQIRNASLSEYRVPRLPDLPEIEVVLLDRPDEPSAGGGETPDHRGGTRDRQRDLRRERHPAARHAAGPARRGRRPRAA